MVHYTKMINGLTRYIDSDILAQLNGNVLKWVGGVAVGLVAQNAEKTFHALADNAMVKALNVIDGENVNVEKIYPLLLEQARKGPATLTIPNLPLPPITFTDKDVESLYRHIMGA